MTILLEGIQELSPVLQKQPEGSALVLINIIDARFNSEVMAAMQKNWIENKYRTKKIAMVGVEGLRTKAYDDVESMAEVKLPTFPDEPSALDYLIE